VAGGEGRKKERKAENWLGGLGGVGGEIWGGVTWVGEIGSGGFSDNSPFIQDLNMNPFFVLS